MKKLQDTIFRSWGWIGIGLILAIILLPILMSVLLSFDDRNFIGPQPPSEFTLKWYVALFKNEQYLRGLNWSFLIALSAVLISTTTGVMAAVYLNSRKFRGRDALLAFFLSPLIIPHVVVGFGLLLAFSRYGIDNAFLRLVAAHVVLTLPFTIRMSLVGLEGMPRSLAEAGMTLGAKPHQVFWTITFPLIRPGIVASAVFAASVSMGEASASAFLVTNKVGTLPLALLSEMRNNVDLTIAAVSGFLIALTIVVVVVLDMTVGLDKITGRGTYRRC